MPHDAATDLARAQAFHAGLADSPYAHGDDLARAAQAVEAAQEAYYDDCAAAERAAAPETLDAAYDRLLAARDAHWDAERDYRWEALGRGTEHPVAQTALRTLRAARRALDEAEAAWRETLAG